MSNYLIELSVIHMAMMLGYWFFLRKERQYSKMRFYLIGTTLLALVIPLLKLPKLLFSSKEIIAAVPVTTIPLEVITITPIAVMPSWNYDLFVWIYVAISGFFLIKLFSCVGYLIYLERKSSYEKFNDIDIRKVSNIKGSFTFFKWIFLSDSIDESQQEYKAILKHEQAHAFLGHSFDLIFIELFRAFFWWLPTSWFINKEIRKIHEYQADVYALNSCDVDQYSSILIRSTLKSNGLSLASSFHDGSILKRIIAMKQQAKNVSPWKLGALMVLGALLFVVFACSEDLEHDFQENADSATPITFDQLPLSMQKSLASKQNELTYFKLPMLKYMKGESKEVEENLLPHRTSVFYLDRNKQEIFIAVQKQGISDNDLAIKPETDTEIFTVVEEPPEFEGGMDAFYKYIGSEIKYPIQARQRGIEGSVHLQFVVEKDGSLSNVKSVKGIGAGCDSEAIRVLQNATAFNPGTQRGKPVRVRMELPINFKINHEIINEDNSPGGMIILDEVTSNLNKFKVEASYSHGEWTGTVYDNEQGEGLPGANILVAGTSTGTASDLDGTFKVKADESDDLIVSFVGYESVKVEGR